MAEVVDGMEDWTLQAIVRQASGDHLTKILNMNNEDQRPNVEFSSIDREFLSSYPEIFDMSIGCSDELEELYKPFYRGVYHPLPTQQSGSEFQEKRFGNDVADKHANESDRSSGTSECVAKVDGAYTPKYKRRCIGVVIRFNFHRKNQQKRVMIQVSADGLGSDMWAWRKYGQKPIKGSPYPRSYYRCSSSKGCLARKQVEQSCSDPGMYIITYTAEHSHSQPTRRNSLAGTVRQKFPNPRSPNHTTKQDVKTASTVSPRSLLQAPCNEEMIRITQENKEEDHIFPGPGDSTAIENDSYNEFDVSDSMFDDEFFSGLDFLDGLVSDRLSCKNL
ncbi:putative WRKY transcription factor 29-like [Dorcoceras hygrometricum]|uniref:Putative WRKY transcription factor 29-like n=1 Tax=Dorcoceras hygrometricum TaxID=472368 RepID=A0A2Z7AGT9_9LAMI|nr:putative WRKY transcription factor 29-like [Dorcoceras hygrometricum]